MGETLISTIAGIKTIIKTTTKTLKQTSPPQVIHLLIHTNAPAELISLCRGHHGIGGSNGMATRPTRNCLRGRRRKLPSQFYS